MDWDLWSSSFDEDGDYLEYHEWCDVYYGIRRVAIDVDYFEHPEWCDLYFGIGRDIIEEDALNEKSRVQVLRIRITNADTEIEELEKDLLSLQNELAWAEYEKWPEICCAALTERINWLDVAISTLKKDDGDDSRAQLLLHNKPADALHEIVKALLRDYIQDSNGQLLDVNSLNPIVNVAEHALEKALNPIVNVAEHELEKELNPIVTVAEHALEKELNPIVTVAEHALEKESNNIDSNMVTEEEAKEVSGTTENSKSSELLLVLYEKRSDDPENVEELLAKSDVGSSDLGDISCSPGHSAGMKLLRTSDDNVAGDDEVRRSRLITADTVQILNSHSSKDNGNIQREAEKENAVVKENHVSSDDAFRLATSVKGRKKRIDSRLGASQQQKARNSDLDEKLCDFAPKTARKACKKGSKAAAPTEDSDSLISPLQVVYPQELCLPDPELCSFKGGNGKNSQQVKNIQNTSLIHAENSALTSLLEMQAKSVVLYTGLQLTDEEKPQAQGPKSKFAANLMNSNISFPSKVTTKGRKNPELEALSAIEPHNSQTEVIPNTSTNASTKRQRKSATSSDDASSKKSMNGKMAKRAVLPGQHETEVRDIVPFDREFSELQKKRVSIDEGNQVDVQISKSSAVDSLKKMTLRDLKVIAKKHNVKKYYKLVKADLVEQLATRLSNC